MTDTWNNMKTPIDRRSFVKNGLTAAVVATTGVGLLANSPAVLADEGPEEQGGRLTRGDAAEIIEIEGSHPRLQGFASEPLSGEPFTND